MQSEGRRAAGAPRWRINLLGGLCARCGDRVFTRFATQKTAALLAYLAYYPQRAHPREALVDLLWPEISSDAARGSFRVALHALRHQLDPADATDTLLVADRRSVALNPAVFTTDVAEMRCALEAARSCPGADERIRHLQRAITLYAGPLLPSWDGDWIFAERQYLQECYLGALSELALALEEHGELEHAIEVARRVLVVDPLREEAHFEVMRLHAAAGQPTAALRQFQELERVLREELGEEPSESARVWAQELRDSARVMGTREWAREGGREGERERQLSADPVELDGSVPVPPSLPLSLSPSLSPTAAPLCRLPAQLTRLVAREEEIDWIAASLRDPSVRLLTLTGPGGIGKTRLAVAAAWRLAEAWDAAVWFIPLADVAPGLAPAAPSSADRDGWPDGTQARMIAMIAEVLDLSLTSASDALDQVVETLARQPSLLVLDNFEHLVEDGALLVHQLLERVPTLTCLVTSRQHLDLSGEHAFAVGPLATPGGGVQVFSCSGVQADDPVRSRSEHRNTGTPEHRNTRTPEHLMQCASVQLFVDRARAVSPAFQLDAENAAAIAAVCDRLEGLPLALELAAAWVRMLTPAMILERLSHRLDLLVGQRRDLAERHRSLRAAMEWSYRLLAPDRQRFLVQLALFRGGWTVEGAEAVTEERRALEYLRQLQECSLVLVEEGGRTMRYRLLESVREFAFEQLAPAEQEALARRHARYCLTLAERAHPDEAQWLRQIDREYENLRAALDWSVTGGAAAAVPAEEDIELGLALCWALEAFWVSRHQIAVGMQYLTTLLARPSSRRSRTRARALTLAGRIKSEQEYHSPVARALLEAALTLARDVEDRPLTARILVHLADSACANKEIAAGRCLYEEALTLYRELEIRSGMATAAVSLAMSYAEDAPARSIALFEEGIAAFRAAGSQSGLAWALIHLSSAHQRRGQYAQALPFCEESLAIFRQLEERIGTAVALYSRVRLALALGDWATAHRHFALALDLEQSINGEDRVCGALLLRVEIALAEGDTETAAEVVERAARMLPAGEPPGVVAQPLWFMGQVALRRGDAAQAAARFRESLRLFQCHSHVRPEMECVEGLAGAALLGAMLLPAGAAPERDDALLHAARLFGAVQALRDRLDAERLPYDRSDHEARIAKLRQLLGEARFTAAWEAGTAMPWAEVVAGALEMRAAQN